VQPAVPIRRSVTPDAIVCLEDGKRFTSIRRHLWVKHGLTPQEYREKWGLKPDYPIVAPAYAQFRSEMAKSMGLGQKGHQRKKRR
jgi:predicted transcriptional regulator